MALAVGYGLTDLVWKLREVLTVLNLLPTRLVWSGQGAWVVAVMVLALVVLTLAFCWWTFRASAREGAIER